MSPHHCPGLFGIAVIMLNHSSNHVWCENKTGLGSYLLAFLRCRKLLTSHVLERPEGFLRRSLGLRFPCLGLPSGLGFSRRNGLDHGIRRSQHLIVIFLQTQEPPHVLQVGHLLRTRTADWKPRSRSNKQSSLTSAFTSLSTCK